MLLGRSGIGKTRFAASMAKEAGVTLRTLIAAKSVKVRCIVSLLLDLKPGDILLIDEVHSLGNDQQQLLYRALDQRQVPAVKSGRLVVAQFEQIAPFCLIVATNRPGEVLPALRRRLHAFEFRPYTTRELTFIARRVAETSGLFLTAQAAGRLAEAAHGTPALVEKRLETLRLSWPNRCRFSQKDIERVLRLEGIDKFGLTSNQRLYLRVLAGSPRGQNTLRRLAIHLGCDTRYVADDVEPGLIFEGYVDANEGPRRQLTRKGRELATELGSATSDDQEGSGDG